MRHVLALMLLVQAFVGTLSHAADRSLDVVIAEPYLEMHTGPGRGYPVFYVVGRGDAVKVLFSRTDWFKVRAPRGQEGWVRREELAKTKLPSGEPAPLPGFPEFASHTWEVGASYGVYNKQNLVSAWGDYALTDSMDVEVVLQEALGTIDNRYIATVGIRHTFVPEWKWASPTVGIGTGFQYIDKATPPKPLETTSQLAYVAIGARGFINKRFMWRAEWRNYVVFTKQNDNKEPREWKVGLAVFF
jgi:Bacterial SH3 domain